jgi:hypothetical protein
MEVKSFLSVEKNLDHKFDQNFESRSSENMRHLDVKVAKKRRYVDANVVDVTSPEAAEIRIRCFVSQVRRYFTGF